MTIGTTVCWPTGDRRYGYGVIQSIDGGKARVYFWPWFPMDIPLSELRKV